MSKEEMTQIKGPNGVVVEVDSATARGMLKDSAYEKVSGPGKPAPFPTERQAAGTGVPHPPQDSPKPSERDLAKEQEEAEANGSLVPAPKPSERDVDEENTDGAKPVEKSDRPAGNAGIGDWREYALKQGKTEDELKDLGRNEIRDLFAK